MSLWVQVILTAAALVLAGGTLWTKLLRPGARVVAGLDTMLPVIKELVEQFHDSPEGLQVLRAIALQFRPNNGTSLRDVIDRLDATTQRNTEAIERLASAVEHLETGPTHE